MTEAEWLACKDSQLMLEFLYGKTSNRKQQLFACACCRRVPSCWSEDPQRTLLGMVERAADGLIAGEEVAASINYTADGCPVLAAAIGVESETPYSAAGCSEHVAYWVADPVGSQRGTSAFAARVVEEFASQANAVRCVFGNPFRPVAFDPTWRTATVTALAQAIYAERAFDRLPILADALEDAGCTNRAILDHCRQPGEHVRGCWVVDLVLDRA